MAASPRVGIDRGQSRLRTHSLMFWAFDHVTCGSPTLDRRGALRRQILHRALAVTVLLIHGVLRQSYATPFTTLPMALPMAPKILPPFTPGVAASERGRSLTTRLPDRLPLFFSMTFLLGDSSLSRGIATVQAFRFFG